MPRIAQHIVSLAAEDDAFIAARIRSGAYSSPSEVLGAGLQALQEQEAALEDWLRNDVAPVFDAMKADPSRGMPASEAFDRIRSRHDERTKSGR